MESRIKIMVFEPGKKPHIEWLKNVTEAYKSVVRCRRQCADTAA